MLLEKDGVVVVVVLCVCVCVCVLTAENSPVFHSGVRKHPSRPGTLVHSSLVCGLTSSIPSLLQHIVSATTTPSTSHQALLVRTPSTQLGLHCEYKDNDELLKTLSTQMLKHVAAQYNTV